MLLAAAVIAASPYPALAAALDGAGWVETLPIETMCSADGALHHPFGATDLPPRLIQTPGMGRTPLPTGYGPFTHVSLDGTKWSGKFYEASYATELDSPEAVLAAISGLAERFEKAGWIALRGDDVDPDAEVGMTDILPGPGEVMLFSDAEGMKPESRTGLRVWLSRMGNELTLACSNLPLFGEHMSE